MQPERRFGTTVYIYVLFIPVSTTLIVGMHEREVVDGSESLIRFSMLSLSAKTLSSRSIFSAKFLIKIAMFRVPESDRPDHGCRHGDKKDIDI